MTSEQIRKAIDVRLDRQKGELPEALRRVWHLRGAIQELEALRRDIDRTSEDEGTS